MNLLLKSFCIPFQSNFQKTNRYQLYYAFSNQKDFQKEIGLKNKVTLMGKIKRFERRKPKIARLIKFYLVFFFLGVITLSLTPGSQLPFQKRLKLGIFHSKSLFNYYWNYEIGKEKEKYLYLQLQDLLIQMSGHQIYDVDEICRVFGEVQKVINEDFQTLKMNFQKEISRQSQDVYLLSNKDQQKINSPLNITENKQKNQKYVNQSGEIPKLPNVNKRSELKQKIKAQLDSKYQYNQQKQVQNKISSNSTVKKVSLQNNPSSQQNKLNNNSSKQTLLNQQQTKSSKIISKTFINHENKASQIDLRNIFWNSITFSPSFNSNMLMYYILVLESVIRSQTQLIKNPKFYQTYLKGVQNFIFNLKVQNFLQENSIKQRKQLKDLNEKLQRQIYFLRVLRKSSMTGNSKNGDGLDTNSEVIDPHKLLTYIIKYRHLIKVNVYEKHNMQKSNQQGIDQKQILQKTQSQQIKELMVNYKNLIDSQSQQVNKKQSTEIKDFQKLQDSSKLIQMAINNKPFIKSIKQLYIQSKKLENKTQLSSKDKINQPYQQKNRKNKNAKQQQNKQKGFENSRNQPVYQIIEQIFETFDKWYQTKNMQHKNNRK